MLFQNALVGALMLAGHASAKGPVVVNALLRRGANLEDVLRRDADLMITLTKRQDANGAQPAPQISSTPASGDAAAADLAKWSAQTKIACDNALSALNGQASNPSGLAVCYNLPFLDNSTGVFQAELRMYNISAPVDPWTGITAADVNMALSFTGATLQTSNGTFVKRDLREMDYSEIKERANQGMVVKRQNANAPVEMKVLTYVGKINADLMASAMTQAALQPLLIPQIELSAMSPSTGQQVTANLSSQEASFLNGIFSRASTTPQAAAANQAPAFVVPGQTLDPRVTKAGLIVTLIWTVGFFGVVGGGTYGRIQFREQYRRRMKNEAARTVRTI